MRKAIKGTLAALAVSIPLTGCGFFERVYENVNYESVTNECGTLRTYSGGKQIREVTNAKIKYADADSLSMWFTDLDTKKEFYWQGFAELEVRPC